MEPHPFIPSYACDHDAALKDAGGGGEGGGAMYGGLGGGTEGGGMRPMINVRSGSEPWKESGWPRWVTVRVSVSTVEWSSGTGGEQSRYTP